MDGWQMVTMMMTMIEEVEVEVEVDMKRLIYYRTKEKGYIHMQGEQTNKRKRREEERYRNLSIQTN